MDFGKLRRRLWLCDIRMFQPFWKCRSYAQKGVFSFSQFNITTKNQGDGTFCAGSLDFYSGGFCNPLFSCSINGSVSYSQNRHSETLLLRRKRFVIRNIVLK
jgi:hypothetical protein